MSQRESCNPVSEKDRQIAAKCDRKGRLRVVGSPDCPLPGALEGDEDIVEFIEKRLALFGEDQLRPRVMEQRRANFLLELPDLDGNGRNGSTKQVRSLLEAASAGDGAKCLEAAKVQLGSLNKFQTRMKLF